MKSVRLLRRVGLALLALVALAYLFREPLLRTSFDFLNAGQPPEKADLAVVLAGDGTGLRILKAAELVRDGYVPAALISGPSSDYEVPECDLAISLAVRRGFPESYFQHLHKDNSSTEEESRDVLAELRARGVHKVLIVTSGYHTRRAGRYYRNLTDIRAVMVAAPERYAERDTWWRNREGRKRIFLEWTKTVTTPFGV